MFKESNGFCYARLPQGNSRRFDPLHLSHFKAAFEVSDFVPHFTLHRPGPGNPLIGETTVKLVKRNVFFVFFFFREFGRRIPLLKVMVPGWRCGFSPWTILVQLKNIERQISISDFFGFPDKTLKSFKKCNIHTYSINECVHTSIIVIHAHSVMYIDELYVFARLRKKDNMFVTCQL